MTVPVKGSKRGKTQLILLLLAFVIPVIAAKLLLSSGFRGEISTHGGQLLTDNLSYQSLALDNPAPGHWQMLFIASDGCDEGCFQRLHYLQQTWRALGRLQERVLIVLATDPAATAASPDFIDLKLIQILDIGRRQLPHDQQLVIVDPQGNLVMLFQLPDDQQQLVVVAHDILLDLKQLLKLSRIG